MRQHTLTILRTPGSDNVRKVQTTFTFEGRDMPLTTVFEKNDLVVFEERVVPPDLRKAVSRWPMRVVAVNTPLKPAGVPTLKVAPVFGKTMVLAEATCFRPIYLP